MIIYTNQSNKWSWKKVAGIYGVSPTTAWRWSMA
ncbi:helix-turn-helix domain-containing protein [Prochlorococcus marinus]